MSRPPRPRLPLLEVYRPRLASHSRWPLRGPPLDTGACEKDPLREPRGAVANLREQRVEETARLPEGGEVLVRVGVPDDPYVDAAESETVAVEMFVGENPVAAVTTVLDVDQEAEARELEREIVAGLESGELPLTAAAIEPLATRARSRDT